MTTQRLFAVSIRDAKATAGQTVRLPLPRTEAEVEKLKARYAEVTAKPVGGEAPNVFSAALTALVRLYAHASAGNDVQLAARVEKAIADLLGEQKHLTTDEWDEHTLIGLGGRR